jgi:hypothetical protein
VVGYALAPWAQQRVDLGQQLLVGVLGASVLLLMVIP